LHKVDFREVDYLRWERERERERERMKQLFLCRLQLFLFCKFHTCAATNVWL
jgi:hypothetical protein